ncbi:MAG: AmmeMemoRadiSam system radical SAM enzyme [Clostridia bacterium]|nr:AmmeMemoRadiSam system radical SAM enzyme [Clostridia bacterium]
MKEADFYEKTGNGAVKCLLCPHHCIIRDGMKGICGVRWNSGGKLYALSYEMISSIALDPMRKKPLDFFMPDSSILSVGSYGCNFKCDFCQNYHISMEIPSLDRIDADRLCEIARGIKGNAGLAFTYNEPFIWYEYVLETCIKNKRQGLFNVLVTNGYVEEKPLEHILPHIDAMNIDLKAFRQDFYKKVCGGNLESVKKTIIQSAGACHVEITNMSVPGMNDSDEEMEEMCRWIEEVDRNIPLHIIAFRPMYKMKDLPPQDPKRIRRLGEIAMRHLDRVVI